MRRTNTRLLLLCCGIALTGWPASTPLVAKPLPDGGTTGVTLERAVITGPNVVVSLGLESGGIIVRGWDRPEVRARSIDGQQIELRRVGTTSHLGPATRVRVLILAGANGSKAQPGEYFACRDIELDVPRGAILRLRTRLGEVDVTDVAEADVDTLSGDIDLRHASRAVEAMSLSGDISVESSSGGIRLRTASGTISVSDASARSMNDYLKASSVSGDINLNRINYPSMELSSTSGNVSMSGPLTRGGHYVFTTFSGDVDIELLDNPSFQLNAKVFRGGVIRNDFPLKPLVEAPETKRQPPGQCLNGTHGDGSASLHLSSFSGDIRVYRQRE